MLEILLTLQTETEELELVLNSTDKLEEEFNSLIKHYKLFQKPLEVPFHVLSQFQIIRMISSLSVISAKLNSSSMPGTPKTPSC